MDPDSSSSNATDRNSVARWPHTIGIGARAKFEDTRWTLVNQAQVGGQATVAMAMSRLCLIYWYPLYAYARRSGQKREDAEDLTQGFFARLLENDLLAKACQEKGRLRTYLLTALKRYMINEWKRVSAEKRGGGLEAIPIDFDQGEDRYGHEPVDDVTPDQVYERQWAMTLLARVHESLRRQFVERGQEDRFETLKDAIFWNSNEVSYANLGAQLGLEENAVKQAVHRMRRKYQQLLRDEIARTIKSEDEAEVEAELRELISVFRS